MTQPTNTVAECSDVPTADAKSEKKPSYLNLACCVSGYSTINTYDSKTRQEISKSREVSPIRPSTSNLQYCVKNNALAPPELLSIPPSSQNQQTSNIMTDRKCLNAKNNNNCISGDINDVDEKRCVSNGSGNHESSFVRQRVERLYGPGALAQSFYSPKRGRNYALTSALSNSNKKGDEPLSELARRFKKLSPYKDNINFEQKYDKNVNLSFSQTSEPENDEVLESSINDLPVLRHLSREFRAQLPSISPKRNLSFTSPIKDKTMDESPNISVIAATAVHDIDKSIQAALSSNVDTQCIDVTDATQNQTSVYLTEATLDSTDNAKVINNINNFNTEHNIASKDIVNKVEEKNGNYFLIQLHLEEKRLLALANDAEGYIKDLENDPATSEDLLGLLRSASGKARLLVNQKMKQFEGLCYKNINHTEEDQFPTTLDDLQGFWDMVNLQVHHIDTIFSDIVLWKNNNWKKPNNDIPLKTTSQKQQSVRKAKESVSNDNKLKAQKSSSLLKREQQRKELMEMKKQKRMALAASAANSPKTDSISSNADSVEIFM